MTMTIEELQRLVDAATPGKRVQFHPAYCEEAKGTPFSEWDTSHDSSAILPDGTRKRIGSVTHAADAVLSDKAPDLARELIEAIDLRVFRDVENAHSAEQIVGAMGFALAVRGGDGDIPLVGRRIPARLFDMRPEAGLVV